MKLYTKFFDINGDSVAVTPIFYYEPNVWCVSHPDFTTKDVPDLFGWVERGDIADLYVFNWFFLSAGENDFYGNGKARKRAAVKKYVKTLPKPPDDMLNETVTVPSGKDLLKMNNEVKKYVN